MLQGKILANEDVLVVQCTAGWDELSSLNGGYWKAGNVKICIIIKHFGIDDTRRDPAQDQPLDLTSQRESPRDREKRVLGPREHKLIIDINFNNIFAGFALVVKCERERECS